MPKPERHVFVCVQRRPPGHPKGSCGTTHEGRLLEEFGRQLDEKGLFGRMMLTSTGCLGPCQMGPNVLVYPDGVMYSGVKEEDVGAIVDEHLLGGKPVERLLTPADYWG